MPRIDETGRFALAGVGAEVSITSADACTVIADRGTAAQWLDRRERLAIYQRGIGEDWFVEVFDLKTGDRQRVGPACSFLSAGNGVWIAWLGGLGLFGTVAGGFKAEQLAVAGLVMTFGTDGRGYAGLDGTIAIVTDYQRGAALQLVAPSGAIVEVPGGWRPGLRVIGAGTATWDDGSIGIPDPRRLPGGRAAVRLEHPLDGSVWWVEWQDANGLVAYRDGYTTGHKIAPLAFHHDATITDDGRLAVTYSLGSGEAPSDIRLIPDVWRALTPTGEAMYPEVDLTAIPIPGVARAVGLLWWEFPNGVGDDAPGHGIIQVPPKPAEGQLEGPTIAYVNGKPVAVYIDAEEDGNTPDAYRREISAARARNPRLPVIAYWPRQAYAREYVPECEYVGVEAYRLAGEPLDLFEARVRSACRRCQRVALVAQCYTSNTNNTNDLVSLVPVYARLARNLSQVVLIAAFSNRGRQTGLYQHPEAREPWARLFSTITGFPALATPPVVVVDPPKPPKPPKPPDPPVEPPQEDEDDMPLIPGEQFEAWIKEAGRIAEPFIRHDPKDPLSARVQAEQGAREVADKYRDPALQPEGLTAANIPLEAMVLGAIFRSGMLPQTDDKLIPLFAEIRRTQERLRR